MQKIAQRSLTWSTHSPKLAHSAQRTAHSVSDNSAQNNFVSSAWQGVFCAHINFRRKFSHNLFGVKPVLLLLAALALLACDPPKSSSPPGPRIERKADGSTITTTRIKGGGTLAIYKDANGKETKRVVTMPHFTLTQKTDKTYALAVADGVTSIAKGEFASSSEKNRDGSIKTELNTRLKGNLLGVAKLEEAITTITLPSTLTRIEDYAFFRHVFVKGTLTIPAKVQSIGKKAFSSVGLQEAGVSLTFANGSQLTTIGDSAFAYSHLSSFALPEQLKTIGNDAFFNGIITTVQDTSSLIIPAKVETIGSFAFFRQKFRGSATLTIRSLDLEKTASTTPLGAKLFVLGSTSPPPFTTIKLPQKVYDSYTKAELEDRFGAGTNYQTLDGTAL